jgi:PAS domain S-box-containing protein
MIHKNGMFDVEKIEQATVQRSANSIIWLNRRAKIRHANAAACQLLIYDYETLTSMRVFDIAPNYNPECVEAKSIMRLKERDKYNFETLVVNRQGMKIPVEVTVFKIKYGEESFFCSIFSTLPSATK